jgi:hypothetical protein
MSLQHDRKLSSCEAPELCRTSYLSHRHSNVDFLLLHIPDPVFSHTSLARPSDGIIAFREIKAENSTCSTERRDAIDSCSSSMWCCDGVSKFVGGGCGQLTKCGAASAAALGTCHQLRHTLISYLMRPINRRPSLGFHTLSDTHSVLRVLYDPNSTVLLL